MFPTDEPQLKVRIARRLMGAAICLLVASLTAEAGDRQPGVGEGASTTGKTAAWKDRLPAPVTDGAYRKGGQFDAEKAELGRLLFFDKILSDNKNISCATCHHPLAGTSDALSLPIGEGGQGLATERDTGKGKNRVHERVPRNSPALFNLGAKQFKTMFHDGRVQVAKSEPYGFRSPAGDALPDGLENVLAVQAMFPVTSATEMAGQAGENGIADAAGNLGLLWELLAVRLRAIPEYVDRFSAVFDDVEEPSDIRYVHAANAIAEFEAAQWRSDNSPFDRYLRGEKKAMTSKQKRGMKLFYGSLDCVSCHSGPFQTDHKFHSIAMPQIGPGKGDGQNNYEDFGRERVTGRTADRYEFRTPSLRDLVVTAPFGHSGAYADLEAVVRHHLDPAEALMSYDPSQAVLPSRPVLDALDFVVMQDSGLVSEIVASSDLPARDGVSKSQIKKLVEFLHSLVDPGSLDLADDVPDSVPSGLPVAD